VSWRQLASQSDIPVLAVGASLSGSPSDTARRLGIDHDEIYIDHDRGFETKLNCYVAPRGYLVSKEGYLVWKQDTSFDGSDQPLRETAFLNAVESMQ
jgi:hypothetical protein